MPNRRNNWYNLHSTRRYPLDDRATGTGDDGARLPADVITDLHLRFPSHLGQYAFLAGLTVKPRLVTAVILATDDIDNPTLLTPIASVHVNQPVAEGIHVPLRALHPQVGGFVVFGDTSEEFVGRFATPRQGLLAPRTARPFRSLPIPSLRRLTNASGLTGLVTLRGQSDVEVVVADVDIPGEGVVRAMVIRLVQTPLGDNVLEKYIGPCGARPESRTCELTPIESINGAVPDCDGNINLLFCQLRTADFESCGEPDFPGGVLIEGSVGIADACAPQQPGRFEGRDQCALSSSSSSLSSASQSSVSEGSLSSESSLSSFSSSSIAPDCGELPYCDAFDAEQALFFEVKVGTFDFFPIDSPEESCGVSEGSASVVPWSYRTVSEFQRNVSVWNACAYGSSLEKIIITDMRLNAGVEENGGVIINWHLVDPLTNQHEEYFHALLDRQENALRLLYFPGTSPLAEIARTTLGAPVVLGDWYRMRVTVQPLVLPNVAITIRVTGISDPAWPAVQTTVPTAQFLPDDGLYGLGSVRGVTDFSFFTIKELP